MKSSTSIHAQRGATLVMGLILLAVLMLTVTISFVMSNSNFKSVGNMQFRSEIAAAVDAAVERLISTDAIFLRPAETLLPPDANGTRISISAPECLRSEVIETGSSADATPTFYEDGNLNLTASNYVETYWDISTTASSTATSAFIETHQGIMIVLPAEPNPCL